MDRYSSAKKASLFGIVGNLFLLIIKGIVGFMSSSQSMIADSVNSAGDILSSLMTFIGNKIASRPSDDDHNLGHGKAEYIYSMLISVVMILVAGKILIDSFFSFINKEKYISSIWLIIVCIITIIVKACLYLYTSKISKKYNNLLVEANSKDHRNDCIITTFNLISCLLSTRGIYFLDGVVGMIISLWIMVTSFQIFKESYDVLMDKSLSIETREKVLKIIRKNKQIKKINHFNSTPVGYRYQISFTIFVDGNMSTFESHEIADNLEREIARKLPEIYLTVIHVNPI
jgi:hypothetical protein